MILYKAFISLMLLTGSSFASNDDQIKSLPGLAVMTSYKQYSGYLDASDTKRFHYWFVESQSSPADDPLVLWLNGGPGCSSLDGLLSENGPLLINNDGETLTNNPYSWNKQTNVLYLESPAGVGYSYDTEGNTKTGDDEVAQNNLNALLHFMKKFPQFAKNDFFITGESYAGVYLPTLAVKLLDNKSFNFKGMAVGNGLSSMALNQNSDIFFAYYHGLFGNELWKPLSKYCCNNNVSAENCQFPNSNGNCQDYTEQANQLIYNAGLNYYALYMDCAGSENSNPSGHMLRYAVDMNMLFPNKTLTHLIKKLPRTQQRVGFSKDMYGNTPPCINSTASTNYLNRMDVRSALHIDPKLPKWDVCNMDVNEHYAREYPDMQSQYKKIMQTPNFRVLIYNGDTDMACNFLGDEWFVDMYMTSYMDAYRSRQPWYVEGQVAGFHKILTQPQTKSSLHYTTIRGAGHMVPQWAPKKAFVMYNKFIKNEEF